MDMAEQANPRRSTAAPVTLDDLPIDLLIRILSLLPILCAVKTSLVSRKWRNLWHLIPILEFYLDSPNHRNPANHLAMANRITQIFLNRPKSNPLSQFRLSFYYFPDHRHRSLVSSWIRFALDCNVEEIELGFYSEEYGLYAFHFLDLKNRPVRCLSLSECEVVMPGSGLIRFHSMRVLSLTTVAITDKSLTSLISKCGNLEKFSLDLGILDESRKFKIRSKSLRVLQLTGYFGTVSENCKESSLEICTPNLSSIEISDFYVDSYKGDLSLVDDAKLLFATRLNYSEKCWSSVMDLLRGVKSLNIQSPSPRFMCSKFKSDGFELEKLKHLELKTCCKLGDVFGLSAVFERCPALEALVLNFMPETNEEKEEEEDEDLDQEEAMRLLVESKTFRFHIPSLEKLKIQGSTDTTREVWIVTLIMQSQKVLKKFVPVAKIPVPANTHRGGFVHYPF